MNFVKNSDIIIEMTSIKYYIQVSDGNQTHTFDVVRDEEELPRSIHYYIGLAYKTYKACVHIEVDVRSKYGVLQGVQTDSECSMEGDMKTIHMLVKGALKHVANKHMIRYFSLHDTAEKHLGSKTIVITPRLLLQGKQGWYQKHFGAIPTQDTYRILESLKQHEDKLKQYLPITSQENWGDYTDITEIAEKITSRYANAIFDTTWIIQKDIVDKYDVTVEEIQYGGSGKKQARWNVSKWYLKKIIARPARRIRRYTPRNE